MTTVTAAYGWVTAILVKDIAAGEVAIAAGMSVQMSALPWAGIGTVEVQATLATFQWASVSTSIELSNPAFVSVN